MTPGPAPGTAPGYRGGGGGIFIMAFIELGPAMGGDIGGGGTWKERAASLPETWRWPPEYMIRDDVGGSVAAGRSEARIRS